MNTTFARRICISDSSRRASLQDGPQGKRSCGDAINFWLDYVPRLSRNRSGGTCALACRVGKTLEATLLDLVNQLINVTLAFGLSNGDSLPPQQRRNIPWESFLLARELSVIEKHGDDLAVLASQNRSDFSTHPVISIVQPPAPMLVLDKQPPLANEHE